MTVLAIIQLTFAILLIAYGVRRFWLELALPTLKFGRKAVHVTDIMIAIPDRLDVLEERTRQLTPNGGSHLHDDIRKTRAAVEELRVWVEDKAQDVEDRLAISEAAVEARLTLSDQRNEDDRTRYAGEAHEDSQALSVQIEASGTGTQEGYTTSGVAYSAYRHGPDETTEDE